MTELALRVAVADLERKTRLLLYALTAMESACLADFEAFRTALEKVDRGVAGLREQVGSGCEQR